MNSVRRNECNPIDYLQRNLFQEKPLIPPFQKYLVFWMVLGHCDVVVGLCGSLQVVLGRCGWFRLVVDGF